jgi:hypothetical protein
MKDFNKDVLIEKFRALISYRSEIKNTVEESVKKLFESAENNAELFIQEIDKN